MKTMTSKPETTVRGSKKTLSAAQIIAGRVLKPENRLDFKSAFYMVGIPTNWRVAGIADFDSDGYDDILWQDGPSGVSLVWYTNGQVLPREGTWIAGKGANWKVESTADFNGDGRPDVLFRNRANGCIVVRLLNGVNMVEEQTLYGTFPDPWKIGKQ